MTSLRTAALLVLALPALAAAQVKLEVTPYFTSYFPTEYLKYEDENVLERHEAGPGLGTAVTWRFSNIWAVEGQATWIKSGIIFKNPAFTAYPPTDAHVILMNARVLFQPRRTNLFFSLGAGVARRGGAAFDVAGLTDKSDTELLAGMGIRTRVNPNWGFRLAVELHTFVTDIDEAGGYYERRRQNDVLVSIGVPFALIGR